MPDFADLLPLVTRRIDDIRTQLDDDANAGVDPTDDRYVDTTPGGHFFDTTQPTALEIERLWDFLGSEVPAGALLAYAFGEVLDDWGDALEVPRKDEVAATGVAQFAGPGGSFVGNDLEIAVPAATPDSDPVTFKTTGSATIPGPATASATVDVAIQATDAGTAGNVGALQITEILSPIDAGVTVSNPSATTGGTDVEADDAYRDRLMLAFAGAQGSGTTSDYQRWALAEPGVGFASVEPVWNGPGTVRVTVTDPDNNPVSAAIITSLQNRLDPAAGKGMGDAPIGHTVTVTTPSSVAATPGATLTFSDGYSLDGANGTIATRAAIEALQEAYIDRLAPGEDVVLAKVESLFFAVEGVYDVSGVTINGVAANLAIDPTQVAAYSGPATLA